MLSQVPGKFINFIGANPDLLKLKVAVNGVEVVGVLDTGSFTSLISESLAKKVGMEMLPISRNINVVGQNNMNTVGEAVVDIALNDVPMVPCKFLVFPDDVRGTNFVILGIDFLKNNRIELCPKRQMVIVHFEQGGSMELYLKGDGNLLRVMYCNIACYSSSNVMLSPGKVLPVPVSFAIPSQHSSDHLVMYSDENLGHKSVVNGISGIMDISNKHILMVSPEKSVQIKEGQNIGNVSSVVEIDLSDEPASGHLSDDSLKTFLFMPECSVEQQTEVFSKLKPFKSVFSSGDADVGLANVTEHVVRLSDNTPIYQKARRVSPPVAEEIERQCQELNALDIIEPSISPYSAPVVPVRKKDGMLRMCIDYRQLNRITIPDKFPVPNLLDSIFSLRDTKFFTRLDLVRGYYQIPIAKESRQYTAFSTPKNHWQFKRLSFGLRNAPSAFQREIQAVLSSLPSNKVVAYLDDILIMGKDFDEHLELVSKVLRTLQLYSIKIKPSKCEWFRSKVEYLGHIVSQSGIKKTDEYVKKIAKYPQPKTVGELREFLGLVNFQRKFVPNCSEIQKPLSCLTGGRKSKILEWDTDMLKAFEKLKSDMMKEVELAYPNYEEDAPKLELWVDASGYGSGACLSQIQDGSRRIIGFASMTFTPTQLNYSTLERELTALRWGVKTFRPFLYGISFILYTDHQPLVHLHNMKIVCTRLARTVEELSDYIFEIRYVPGHLNSAADALSRIGSPPVPETQLNFKPELPKGLVLHGLPVEGGGDSLFVSLMRLLNDTNKIKVPLSMVELRYLLVDELSGNAAKYNIQLDRNSRKVLHLMRHPGQLPSLDLLLAVSRLFQVKVYVYFWSDQPVVYQFDEYADVIHLQCISGVHFNPLIELLAYEVPVVNQHAINSVYNVSREARYPKSDVYDPFDADEDDEYAELLEKLLYVDPSLEFCKHEPSELPHVCISMGNQNFCAILDTGAQLSLVSKYVLDKLSESNDIILKDEYLCDIRGFSGVKIPIMQTAELSFDFGSYSVANRHKFGVIDDGILPHCMLIGLDFFDYHNIDIDLSMGICRREGEAISSYVSNDGGAHSAVLCCQRNDVSDTPEQLESGDFRFSIERCSNLVTGISLLMNNDLIKDIQSKDAALKSIIKLVKKEEPIKNWPKNLKPYFRHASKLFMNNGILAYNGPNPVVVIPFNHLVELTVNIHRQFAHIGRDKVLDLLFNRVWHPSKYRVANDVCTTCHQCQTLKGYSTVLIPPTLKICTNFPFEMIAADCMSLPTTSAGYVACLVVVDHYTKWVSALPLRNKKSATVINALKNIFSTIPKMPISVLTDNGPEFISGEFESFLTEYNVAHKLTSPNHPSSNGACERVNRTIQNFLNSLVSEGSGWDVCLPKAVITYNHTFHSELCMSPSNFVLVKPHVESADDIPFQGNLIQRWKVGHPKYVPFSVGQHVLMKIEQKGSLNINKLSPKFKGPYKISKVNENGVTYQLINPNSGAVIRTHHAKLRVYKLPPIYLSNNALYKELNDLNDEECMIDRCSDAELVDDFCDSSSDTDFVNNDLSRKCSMNFDVSSNDDSLFSGFSGSLDVPTSSALSLVPVASPVQTMSSCKLPSEPCKGCKFERDQETNKLTNANKSFVTFGNYNNVMEEQNVDEEGSSILGEGDDCEHGVVRPDVSDMPNVQRRSVQFYRLALGWNDDEDWKFSSIDDVDDDIAPIGEIVDVPPVVVNSLESSHATVSDNIEGNSCTTASETEKSFVGFEHEKRNNVDKLNEVLDKILMNSVEQCGVTTTRNSLPRPHTRSRGCVKDFPNVQTITLERRKRNTST